VAVGPAPSNPPVAGSALPPSRIRVDVAGTVDTSKPPALRQDMHELMPAPAVAGVTYKVQSGDTLYKIAHKIYGAGHEAEYTKIYKANQSKIPASFALTVGAELVIPDAPADSAAAATPAAPTAPKNGLKDLTASGKKDASIGELKKAVKGTTDAPAVASNPDSSVLRTPESPAAQNTKATAISTKDLKGKLAPGSGDATVSAAAKKYVIKSGDSLMQIARNQMGDSSKASVQKLLEANKDRIKDPRQLKIGTELRIPQA
jgi:nucleoid-associated protein YgaU